MDGVVRCLRGAVRADEGAACTAVVADDARVGGDEGWETFAEALRLHTAVVAAGKAHARETLLIAGAHPHARYRLQSHSALRVVDLHSDPYGWLARADAKAGAEVEARAGAGAIENGGSNDAHATAAAVGGGGGQSRGVIRSAHMGDISGLAATIAAALGPSSHEPGTPGATAGAASSRSRRHDGGEELGAGAGAGAGGGEEANDTTNDEDGTGGGGGGKGKRSGLWGYTPKAEVGTPYKLNAVDP
jgi:hypothetical protein